MSDDFCMVQRLSFKGTKMNTGEIYISPVACGNLYFNHVHLL